MTTRSRPCVENVNLFCRVNPAQKNRVILALKQRGRVVGYMGDGINDAPSLHSADIGISVDSAVDVAKSAAEMILLEQDLNVLHEGVVEGRRTFGNIMKYIMMGTSSNFGNMFSMAGATLFLPFLPMLPVQILLNNLLYDVSEIPIPLDSVDEEYLTQPRHWNMNFIRNFMLSVGPVSSIFDFLTFYIMLHVFHAGEKLFHTGWFIESMATQVLVIFIIRTRRNPFKSRPNLWLTLCSLSVVCLAVGTSVHAARQVLRVRAAAIVVLCDPGRPGVVLSLCGRRDQAVVFPPICGKVRSALRTLSSELRTGSTLSHQYERQSNDLYSEFTPPSARAKTMKGPRGQPFHRLLDARSAPCYFRSSTSLTFFNKLCGDMGL